MNKVTIIVGAQYGSEAKGEFTGYLARKLKNPYCVRTGSINAGHTVYYEGKPYKMQQIPVGWVNPVARLVIGAGAYVNPEILERELKEINKVMGFDNSARLYIDFRAGIHLPKHHEGEKGLHERMGSTGEGCMEAIVDKMKRGFDYQRFSETEHALKYQVIDTMELLNKAYDAGGQILIEGTQGTLLDLHFGHYPFVTSRQTTAANWITEAGLSPALEYEVVMVGRVYPIRVAGNSGPLPQETSWDRLAENINARLELDGKGPLVDEDALRRYKDKLADKAVELGIPMYQHEASPQVQTEKAKEYSILHQIVLDDMMSQDLEELKKFFEMTTVTKKLRRVAELDLEELKRSIMLNRPSYLVLNFLNYTFPEIWGVKSWPGVVESSVGGQVVEYLRDLESKLGVPIQYVSTAKDSIVEVTG